MNQALLVLTFHAAYIELVMKSCNARSWQIPFLGQNKFSLASDDFPCSLHMMLLYVCAAQSKAQCVLAIAQLSVNHEQLPA